MSDRNLPQHFLTLELELSASESEIKNRRIADLPGEVHPDLNSSPEAKTKFLAVKEAYEKCFRLLKKERIIFRRGAGKTRLIAKGKTSIGNLNIKRLSKPAKPRKPKKKPSGSKRKSFARN
ncbi:MAG: hypothetical protein R2688_04080 [Fimbriimonadaceae bacterium]